MSFAFVPGVVGVRRQWTRCAMVPKPLGKYSVGVVDVELPKRNDEGLMFRVFYPTREVITEKEEVTFVPSLEYAKGYISFLGFLPKWMVAPIGWLTWRMIGMMKMPGVGAGRNLLPAENAGRLPVVIFSHGLGGNRTSYSLLCRDMASDGSIVFSMEHRDGSASTSVVTDEQGGQQVMGYSRPERGRGAEYEYAFRRKMLEYRTMEVTRLLKFIGEVNSGVEENCSIDHVAANAFLKAARNRLDMHKTAIVGHSFGGATAVQMAAEQPNNFTCCVALDPWFYSLTAEMKSPDGPRLTVPLLVLNNDVTWWPKNIENVDNVVRKTDARKEYYTLLGATHQAQSDIALLLGPRLAKALKLSKNGDDGEVLRINNIVVMRFLRELLEINDAGVLPPFDEDRLIVKSEETADVRSPVIMET